jgi:hypothetical protein
MSETVFHIRVDDGPEQTEVLVHAYPPLLFRIEDNEFGGLVTKHAVRRCNPRAKDDRKQLSC